MSEQQLEGLHWTQLKKLVEEAGGEWTDSDGAIEFLQGGANKGADNSTDAGDIDLSSEANDEGIDAPVAEDVSDAPIVKSQDDDVLPDAPEEDAESISDAAPVFYPDEYYSTVHGAGVKGKYRQKGNLFDARHNFVPGDEG